MWVTTENLVGTFSGENNFVACIPDRAAQEVFRNAVCVEAEIFRTRDGVSKVIREIVLPDWNGEELGAGFRRHFSGDFALVVFRPIESQSESADGPGMPCCQPQHSARVQPAA